MPEQAATETLPAERHEIVEDVPVTALITDEFITAFEKQSELYQSRYLPACLRLTNEQDWCLMGTGDKAKLYLQASGAEKLCTPLGINWDAPSVKRVEREDAKGKFYRYEVEGIIRSESLKRYIWTIGTCDSRDQFFNARKGWTPAEGEGDVQKAAYSNWLVNGITRLAGIRNPSRTMIERAGLKLDNIGKIDYSGANTSATASGETITDGQIKRLLAIAHNEVKVEDAKLIEWLCGKDSYIAKHENVWEVVKQIKKGDYEKIIEKLKARAATKTEEREPGQEG